MAAGDKKPRPIGEDLISRECPVLTQSTSAAAAAGACEGGAAPTAAQVDAAIATAVAPIVTALNKVIADNVALRAQIKNAGIIHDPA